MSFKYGLLSLLAFCVGLLLFLKDYQVWTQPIEVEPQKGVEKRVLENSKAASIIEPQRETNSLQSHTLIAEKNIFSPERRDFPSPIQQTKAKVRPQVILYGVTIAGDVQFATLVNPGRPLRKGERETTSLKAGERIGEYKLASILPDRVILESGEDKFEVLISDPKAPKKRDEIIRTVASPVTVASQQAGLPPTVEQRPMTVPPREPVQEVKAPPVPMKEVPLSAPKRMTDIPVSAPKMPEVSSSVPMPMAHY